MACNQSQVETILSLIRMTVYCTVLYFAFWSWLREPMRAQGQATGKISNTGIEVPSSGMPVPESRIRERQCQK
eukprot:4835-Pleurochrysis_carterae.AAC.1